MLGPSQPRQKSKADGLLLPRHAALSRASRPIRLRLPRNMMLPRPSHASIKPKATTTTGGRGTASNSTPFM